MKNLSKFAVSVALVCVTVFSKQTMAPNATARIADVADKATPGAQPSAMAAPALSVMPMATFSKSSTSINQQKLMSPSDKLASGTCYHSLGDGLAARLAQLIKSVPGIFSA